MTLTVLPRISNEIASGAQVSYTFDVAKNTSEGGISGRIAMRPIVRNYMISPDFGQSNEMVKMVMATRGARYPMVIRDYANNYQLTDETITHSGTTATIGRTWAPSTGSLSVYERILYVDQTEQTFTVKVNGTPLSLSPAGFTLGDFGRITIPGLVDGDTVTVSGQYCVPVCFVDTPTTTIVLSRSGSTLHQFSDIRLEQIFETELTNLTS
jgi:hypothetical protein